MSDEGFILIQRKITGWKWWHNNTARGLWLYLLVSANWKSGYLGDGNEIKRGQVCKSLRTMAAENDVNVKTIRYWLKKFEESGEIVIDRAHRYHVINIVNYGKYQDKPDDKGTRTGTITGTITGTNTGTITGTDRTRITRITRITNKDIGDVKTSHTSKRFTPPTAEEVKDYANSIGFASLDAERFVDYYSSKGWMIGKNHMKDWKAAVRTWRKNDTTPQNEVPLPEYMNHPVPESKPANQELIERVKRMQRSMQE